MGKGNAYATNDAKAISETLGGETIIINLESGVYFSLNATGSAVWDMVKASADEDAMVTALVRTYEVDAGTATQALRTFLDALLADDLIVRKEAASSWSSEELTQSSSRPPFVSPTVQRYEDMKEMLLADPIHDVDERGWPIIKQ